jgi:hypothetical protein
MKFANAIKLLTDGHVGNDLIATCSLPADLFPDGTWNSALTLSDDDRERLASFSFGCPLPGTSSGPLQPLTATTKRTRFIQDNAGAVRFTPDTRLWHSDDIYASQQRSTSGSSIMVVRILRDDGTYSDPLLLITGPMATPFKGDGWESREILSLDATAPLPTIAGAVTLPESMAPTSVSLAPAPRELLASVESDSLLPTVRSQGGYLTILDSSSLHSTVLAYDPGNFISSRVWEQQDVEDRKLFLPVMGPDTDQPDPELTNRWYNTAPVPPDPRTSKSWLPDDPNTLNSRPADTPYSPDVNKEVANIQPTSTQRSEAASYMLLPRFLRFPYPMTLPTGLVMRPSALTGTLFREILSYFNLVNAQTIRWLENAILDTWFAAVAANPTLFQVDAITHTQFLSLSPPTGNAQLLAIRLHQEWALTSQLLWDHSFASVAKGTLAGQLHRYAAALVHAHNSAETDDALNNTLLFTFVITITVQ